MLGEGDGKEKADLSCGLMDEWKKVLDVCGWKWMFMCIGRRDG